MKAFSRFSGLVIILALFIWLVGCGQDSMMPTEDDVGQNSLAVGQNQGSAAKNYNPLAGVETKDGSRQLVIEDGLSDRLPDAETLRQWAEKDPQVLMAPAVATLWYRTNAAFVGKGQSGLETKEDYSLVGQIVFKTAPNNLTGVSEYWIMPKRTSSSGEPYYYLKLDGKLPTHAEAGKLYFKVDDNGRAYWLAKGSKIYQHTIVFENSGVSSGATMYVRGIKSTAGQWQRMDYKGSYQWQYDPVLVEIGRESLEFRDGSGNYYKWQAIIDRVKIEYYDRNNNWLPTFEYTATGVRSLGSNIFDLDITVVDSGGIVPPLPSGEAQPYIEGTLLKIERKYMPNVKSSDWVYMLGDMLDGNVPGSGWNWAKRSQDFAARAEDRWIEISLLNLPQGNSHFNLISSDGQWLIWDQDGVRDSYLWKETTGGKVLGVKRSGNTFSKIY